MISRPLMTLVADLYYRVQDSMNQYDHYCEAPLSLRFTDEVLDKATDQFPMSFWNWYHNQEVHT